MAIRSIGTIPFLVKAIGSHEVRYNEAVTHLIMKRETLALIRKYRQPTSGIYLWRYSFSIQGLASTFMGIPIIETYYGEKNAIAICSLSGVRNIFHLWTE